MTEQEIKDRYVKVCICKSISKGTIKNAIKEGATTLSEIKRKTRAGSGSCRGSRCQDKILALIEEAKNEQAEL